ncbi:MAG: 3-dehydroquinate synthase [Treponema sp.]|jgi:3-dehydroquinate synthase|nr:3-dehydroquinate synthase [Treponema sp.]
MRSVTINASKTYDILIGDGLLSQAGEKIAAVCKGESALIVTDDAVNALYGSAVEQSLQKAGYKTDRFVFQNGEQSKNLETYTSILSALAKTNISRSDVLVALGGGVTGDMAGFAAATYLRGIRFVQIPTTLLAMVDSSVGGKTAVDLPSGKNQVGVFYQPDIVLCDYSTLKTLPEEFFTDGCAEVIKHGVILSAELFDLLKKPILPQMEDIIARNVTIKSDIVMQDERETGIRQILNFGHTIGHGIEKHSNYRISHGKAVAIGMVVASRGAWRMGLCSEDCHTEIVDMVKQYRLPDKTDITPEQLISAAFFDKKRSGKNISLIIPEKIGKCVIKSFSMDELAAFIKMGMSK